MGVHHTDAGGVVKNVNQCRAALTTPGGNKPLGTCKISDGSPSLLYAKWRKSLKYGLFLPQYHRSARAIEELTLAVGVLALVTARS